MRLTRILPLLTLPFLAACDGITGSDVNQHLLYVAPYTRECVGVGVMQCMLVKENPADEWQFFYGGIDGFAYEPGYDYTLFIGWREVENPPADGSSRDYWLIRLVEKTPAGIGD